MIRCENIGLRYGSQPEVLSDISLDIRAGSFHYVYGQSGVGKSTLLKLFSLELAPDRGQLFFDGWDVTLIPRASLPVVRRKIGVVSQDFRLISSLSVYDNVALPLRLCNMEESRIREVVNKMLDWVGLQYFHTFYPQHLSGGQQQHLAIARAVANHPKILIADEPTANIDDAAAWRLMELFEELHQIGTTVVVATHDQAMMKQFPHQTVTLEKPRREHEALTEMKHTLIEE